MYISTVLLFFGSGLLASAADQGLYAPVALTSKRAVMSCEQTYGAGSVSCGNSNTSMCYNPSQGQSCCATDNGYCEKGQFCAPVAGFCCVEGEDLAGCAKNAGFTLPALVPAASSPSVSSTTAASSASATSAKPSAASGSPAPKGKNSTSNTPYVQVSVARKEQWTLVYMTLGIGAVGLIMAMF